MSVNELHVNDTGVIFRATVKDSGTALDISGATTKYFLLAQPGGSVTSISATYVNSGTNGQIQFTTSSTHLDQQGKFKIQAFISDGSNSYHTDIYQFSVSSNLI